jgi:hypothetical protein
MLCCGYFAFSSAIKSSKFVVVDPVFVVSP